MPQLIIKLVVQPLMRWYQYHQVAAALQHFFAIADGLLIVFDVFHHVERYNSIDLPDQFGKTCFKILYSKIDRFYACQVGVAPEFIVQDIQTLITQIADSKPVVFFKEELAQVSDAA